MRQLNLSYFLDQSVFVSSSFHLTALAVIKRMLEHHPGPLGSIIQSGHYAIPERGERENGLEEIFKEIMVESLPRLINMSSHKFRSSVSPNGINTRRLFLGTSLKKC